MAMRETAGTLRFYFILIAIVGATLVYGLELLLSKGNILVVEWDIVGLGFCVAYFCVGVYLPRLLLSSSRTVTSLICATMGWLVLQYLLFALVGTSTVGGLFRLVFALLINWYLLKNVQRLAREAQTPTPSKERDCT